MTRMAGHRHPGTARCVPCARAFAFHIAGDQHLGSTIQYGVEEWNDAGWAICVPSVANIWPRRWFPPKSGAQSYRRKAAQHGRIPGRLRQYRMTVHAVSNPTANGIEPTALNHRAPWLRHHRVRSGVTEDHDRQLAPLGRRHPTETRSPMRVGQSRLTSWTTVSPKTAALWPR